MMAEFPLLGLEVWSQVTAHGCASGNASRVEFSNSCLSLFALSGSGTYSSRGAPGLFASAGAMGACAAPAPGSRERGGCALRLHSGYLRRPWKRRQAARCFSGEPGLQQNCTGPPGVCGVPVLRWRSRVPRNTGAPPLRPIASYHLRPDAGGHARLSPTPMAPARPWPYQRRCWHILVLPIFL